jgi:hypothetical protein
MRQNEIDENIRSFLKQLDKVIEEKHPTDTIPYFQIKAQILLSLKDVVPYVDYTDKNGTWE